MTSKPAKRSSVSDYAWMLGKIKTRIRTAQVKAVFAANREMILLYWDIGRMIAERQQREGWGAAVIPRLARDIRNELPEVKGFSERNIGYMIRFAREYGAPILQQAAAKLPEKAFPPPPLSKLPEPVKLPIVQQLAAQIPWFHHVLLMEKVPDLSVRLWYMRQIIEQGWSRNTLALMITGSAYERQGQAVSNFADRLPPAQSDLAQQTLKDPYIFDFLTLEEPFHERELETNLVRHLAFRSSLPSVAAIEAELSRAAPVPHRARVRKGNATAKGKPT